MTTIQITKEDNLAVIQLDRGKSNPINTEMFLDLQQAFTDLQNDDSIHGAVLTGKGNFFSAGLDVIELYAYNEKEIGDLFEALFDTVKVMLSFSKPLVASITGHSPAGGCVLALCCDYRIMAKGKYRIGLNEVPVGIVMPKFIYALYEQCIGARKAYQFILDGKLLLAEEALAEGVVDAVVELEDVFPFSVEKVKQYMKFSPSTWQKSKMNMRQDLLTNYSSFAPEAKAEILTQWWSDETRKVLGALVAHLTKK